MKPSEVAEKYIGQTEKSGNMGFNDVEFEKKMFQVGFHLHDSWCCYFQELVFKEAFPEKFKEFDKLFSANSVQTFHNFKAAGYPTSLVPAVDSLVVFQSKKDGKPVNVGTEAVPIYTGHIGVVAAINENDATAFYSIEGNTSTPGVREGYIVAKNPHRIVGDVQKGLEVIGFIQMKNEESTDTTAGLL